MLELMTRRSDSTLAGKIYRHIPSLQVDCANMFSILRLMSADQLYTWINRHLPEGPKPPLVRPINYIRLISGITLSMGAVTLFTVLSPYVLPIVRNRNIWAAASLISILLFTSGHMFNHIRRVPYVVGDGKGGISYFAGGFSMQFGMETQIVAAICESQSDILLGAFLNAYTINLRRCHSLICNNCSCNESASYGRRESATSGCGNMGGCLAWHVQFSPQCFQG